MLLNTVRWNVAISEDTDQSLRMFMAKRGGGRKGDLSRTIEEAVKSYIFEQTAEQVKSANRDVSEGEMAAMIDEALEWTRNN
jgi:hypothetical protein